MFKLGKQLCQNVINFPFDHTDKIFGQFYMPVKWILEMSYTIF